MKYFADTYALIEMIKGNPSYDKYADEELGTSILNLYELFFNLLRSSNEEVAKQFFYYFLDNIIQVQNKHIFSASKFKLLHNKKDISYADALGYAIAVEENMKFLTGDQQFKTFENVEFVK